MDDRPNLRYPITLSDGAEVWPEKQWQWSKDRVQAAFSNNELVITKKAGKITVSYKQYLKDPEGEERKRKPTSLIEGYYTQHGTYEGMAIFGLENKFAFPKPEGLINTIFEAATGEGDLVLDSFLGSGTTAAVAHKMSRRWIGIEMGEHAETHCIPRLEKVINGEQGGISQTVGWQGGGGFRYYKLDQPVFLADGGIDPAVRFAALAAYLWHFETGRPASQAFDSPFLGEHAGKAYYLLYNGILGDRRPQSGNVLTAAVLARLVALRPHPGPKTIYGECSHLGMARLVAEDIEFKQIPYDVRVR